jgi:hypothetical protein
MDQRDIDKRDPVVNPTGLWKPFECGSKLFY